MSTLRKVSRWFFVAVSVLSLFQEMDRATSKDKSELVILHMLNQTAYNFRSRNNHTKSAIRKSSTAVATNSTRLVGSKNNSTSFESLRIAIFITTHLNDEHISFLRRCWSAALEIVPMLRQSDCILFSAEDPPSDIHSSVFQKFHSFQVYKYENPGYQEGAVLAMVSAMDNGWFEDYDWVLRVNADVVIRDDSFFRRAFVNPFVDAIFVKCGVSVQTDFFAFRPNSTAPGAFKRQRNPRRQVAEQDTTLAFKETLQQTKRYMWLEGGHSNGGSCRVVGRDSPVIHDHRFLNQCPHIKSHHTARRQNW